MGLADLFHNDHKDFHHKGSVTHEVLGGAVTYELAKAYEDHIAKNGQPSNHAKAVEIASGLAGFALTRLAETKGLDAWDAHQQKKAQENAVQRFSETVLVNQY